MIILRLMVCLIQTSEEALLSHQNVLKDFCQNSTKTMEFCCNSPFIHEISVFSFILLQIHKNTINLKNQFRLLRLPLTSWTLYIFQGLSCYASWVLGIIDSAVLVLNVIQTCFLIDGGWERKYQKSEAHHINQKLLHVVTMINRSENIYQEKLSLGALCHTWIKKQFCKKMNFSPGQYACCFMFINEV